MLPLWANAIPKGQLVYKGWASAVQPPPAVGYLTWPIPTLPNNLSIWSCWNTSATVPSNNITINNNTNNSTNNNTNNNNNNNNNNNS